MPNKDVVNMPLSLNDMTGGGEIFTVGGKKYTVKPLKLREIPEYNKDSVNVGPQLFSMLDERQKTVVDKWLGKKVEDEKGNPMSIERAEEDDWSLTDLRQCLLKIIDVSG